MGKKGPMPSFKTIDDYIDNQPIHAQRVLKELRSLVNDAAPDAIEMPDYKVPSFTLVPGGKRDQQIMMAGYANFVSFYPFPSTMEKFSNELKEFKQGKGCIQFPFDAEIPKSLIKQMVQHRREEILKDWK